MKRITMTIAFICLGASLSWAPDQSKSGQTVSHQDMIQGYVESVQSHDRRLPSTQRYNLSPKAEKCMDEDFEVARQINAIRKKLNILYGRRSTAAGQNEIADLEKSLVALRKRRTKLISESFWADRLQYIPEEHQEEVRKVLEQKEKTR